MRLNYWSLMRNSIRHLPTKSLWNEIIYLIKFNPPIIDSDRNIVSNFAKCGVERSHTHKDVFFRSDLQSSLLRRRIHVIVKLLSHSFSLHQCCLILLHQAFQSL